MVFKKIKKKYYVNRLSPSQFLCKTFVGILTRRGNKKRSFNSFFFVLLILSKVYKIEDPINFMLSMVEIVRPRVAFTAKRVAGIVYKLPRFIPLQKSLSLGIRWIINAASARGGNDKFSQKMVKELIDLSNGVVTTSIKKKIDSHNLARSNRPFLRYLKRKKK
jgi:small subunit ribosomal protein S7